MENIKNKTYLQGAVNSYKKNPDDIGKLDLIIDTPTLDAYKNESTKTILITIRGTKVSDLSDLGADAVIAGDLLESTDRFKKDDQILQKIFETYPPNKYRYFMTGHSLGGALSSIFLRKYPFIIYSVVWNSAVTPSDAFTKDQNPKVKYFYIDADKLYQTGGFLMKNKHVFRYNDKVNGLFDRFKSIFLPKTTKTLKAHSLDQFYDREINKY